MILWGLVIKMIITKYWIVFRWKHYLLIEGKRKVEEGIFLSGQEAADYICQQENWQDYGIRSCWRSEKWYFKQIAKREKMSYDVLMELAINAIHQWQLNKLFKTDD